MSSGPSPKREPAEFPGTAEPAWALCGGLAMPSGSHAPPRTITATASTGMRRLFRNRLPRPMFTSRQRDVSDPRFASFFSDAPGPWGPRRRKAPLGVRPNAHGGCRVARPNPPEPRPAARVRRESAGDRTSTDARRTRTPRTGAHSSPAPRRGAAPKARVDSGSDSRREDGPGSLGAEIGEAEGGEAGCPAGQVPEGRSYRRRDAS